MSALVDDRSIVIKKADKGSTVVVWDCNDYILNAEKQLSDANVYKYVSFNENISQDLVGTNNQLFQDLKSKGKLVVNSLNTIYIYMSTKKFLTFIFYLRFTRDYIMFLGDLWFQILEHLQRKILSF